MSRRELELLSEPAGATRTLLFIWKPFRHLMLFRGQNFSFICPHFLLPQWDEGFGAGANPALGLTSYTHHCMWCQGDSPAPGADV